MIKIEVNDPKLETNEPYLNPTSYKYQTKFFQRSCKLEKDG